MINSIKKLNSWDIKSYNDSNSIIYKYSNLLKKKSQIVPQELLHNINNETCAICLKSFSKSIVYLGVCGHAIHKNCVLDYIKCLDDDSNILLNMTLTETKYYSGISCPVCRCKYIRKDIFKIVN